MNRRGFLGLLGLGAASPGLAANAISPQVPMPAMGFAGQGGVGFDHALYMRERRSALDLFRTSKEVYEAVREQAALRVSWRDPRHLDPDIARHRAWSDSYKVLKQKERDIQRAVDEMTREEPTHIKLMRLGIGGIL